METKIILVLAVALTVASIGMMPAASAGYYDSLSDYDKCFLEHARSEPWLTDDNIVRTCFYLYGN